MKKLALTLTIATLALGMTALTASAQTQQPGAAALHAQAQNFTPIIEQAACGGRPYGCGPGWTYYCGTGPYGRTFCGATPAGKHRDQAAAIIRKHGEPPQGGSFIFVHLRIIDLDRFKDVNDSLGHDAGDLLLQTVAKRFSNAVRDEDTVARLGGDEFVVVFQGLHDGQDAAMVAKKLLSCLVEPVTLNGYELTITASMGISLYPDDATNGQEMIRNADAAMYQAKSAGRNAYQFYTSDLNQRALEMLSMENALRRAIERQEFVLHYQPQVDISSGSVVGAEALIRWNHPELGLRHARQIHLHRRGARANRSHRQLGHRGSGASSCSLAERWDIHPHSGECFCGPIPPEGFCGAAREHRAKAWNHPEPPRTRTDREHHHARCGSDGRNTRETA